MGLLIKLFAVVFQYMNPLPAPQTRLMFTSVHCVYDVHVWYSGDSWNTHFVFKVFAYFSDSSVKDGNSPNLTIQYNTAWVSFIVLNFDVSSVFPRNGQIWDGLGWVICSDMKNSILYISVCIEVVETLRASANNFSFLQQNCLLLPDHVCLKVE